MANKLDKNRPLIEGEKRGVEKKLTKRREKREDLTSFESKGWWQEGKKTGEKNRKS